MLEETWLTQAPDWDVGAYEFAPRNAVQCIMITGVPLACSSLWLGVNAVTDNLLKIQYNQPLNLSCQLLMTLANCFSISSFRTSVHQLPSIAFLQILSQSFTSSWCAF